MCKCKLTSMFLCVVMLLSMTMGGLSVSAATTSENLVANGDFEQESTGEAYDQIVPGWAVWGSATEKLTDAFSYSTEEKISETRSLKIFGDSTASRAAQFTLGMGEQYKGKTYILSFYAKNIDSDMAYVNFNDSADTSTRLYISNNNTWTKYTHKFKASEDRGLVRFSFNQLRKATVYLDAVTLVEVDTDNMLYNGGMEIPIYENGTATPDLNHQYTDISAGTYGKEYAFDGDVGMHMSVGDAGSKNIFFVLTNTDTSIKGAPFKAEERLVFSYNVRSNVRLGLKIVCKTALQDGFIVSGYGTTGLGYNSDIFPISQTDNMWKKQEFGFVLPEGCTYINITVFTYNNDAKTGYADYDNFDLRVDKTNVTYNNVTTEGTRETEALTAGTVSAHVRVVETAAVNPVLVSVLYKTNGAAKQIQDVKIGTIQAEDRGTKVADIGNFTIPSENTKDYSLVTYVLSGTELKALIPQATLNPAA